ncbi:hypothetical protein MPER_12829 [Moniliophthora perniciosa FA553]|nr:hypothetical protein MPER_12829 [Moniliophthora perniciosa FA553]
MLVGITEQQRQTRPTSTVILNSRGRSITDSDPDVTLEIVVSDSSEGDSNTHREATRMDEEARSLNTGHASDSATNPPPYQLGPSRVGMASGGALGRSTDHGDGTTPSGNKGFVVYRGKRPGFYRTLHQAHPDDRSSGGVFKGFPSYEIARDVYQRAFQTGVIGALNDEPLDGGTPEYYVVVQGIQPAVYSNASIPALRDGLGWRGGAIYVFHNRGKADAFFAREITAGRTRQWALDQ